MCQAAAQSKLQILLVAGPGFELAFAGCADIRDDLDLGAAAERIDLGER